jgi:outer membrane protein OmpA-like peptidoglycan-associated protein
MTSWYFKSAVRLAGVSLVAGFLWSVAGVPAMAQTVSAGQIIKTLTPPVTRSLSAPDVPAMSDSDRAFVEGLRHRTRSLTVDESDHVAEIAKDKPKIDLEIYFDFNSAAITPKAESQLNELATALRSPGLEKSVIVLGGHTDAKGSDDYNQDLSQRRAEAAKKYMVDTLKISPDNLTTAGYGRRDLKNKAQPFAAENRRVQIVNLGGTEQAQR